MPPIKFTYECRAVSHFSKAGAEFANRCTFVDPDVAYARMSPSVGGSCYKATGTYTLKK